MAQPNGSGKTNMSSNKSDPIQSDPIQSGSFRESDLGMILEFLCHSKIEDQNRMCQFDPLSMEPWFGFRMVLTGSVRSGTSDRAITKIVHVEFHFRGI